MEDLEQQLIKANEAGSRFKIIVTDGVFYGWCCCTFTKFVIEADMLW
jgi:hypothetical protein